MPATSRTAARLQAARTTSDELSSRLTEGEGLGTAERSYVPSEEVSDLIQRHQNHFPELEAGAEELLRKAKLQTDDLYPGLIRHLEKEHGNTVQIARTEAERGTLRRYDPDRKVLTLSELLPTRSRTFALAYQLGILTQHRRLEALASDGAYLTTEESRTLARVALANWKTTEDILGWHE